MKGKIETKPTKKTNKSIKTTPKKFKFKINRILMKRYAILIVVALALLGIWELGRQGGSWGESDALRIVKAEKIASKDLLGLKLVNTMQYGENGLIIIEKTSPGVNNTFKPKDDNIDKTLKQIIAYAEADGWVRDSSLSDKDWWSGQKHPNKNLELVVNIYRSEDDIIVGVSGYENR